MVEDKIAGLVDKIRDDMVDAGNDPEKLKAVIEQGAAVVDAYESVRQDMRTVMERAFLAGVDPTDLFNKPYTPAYVLRIYNSTRAKHPEAKLPERKRGRAFSRPPS